MPKIPVGQTVEVAYRFAFRHFFAVLAILWFPYFVVIAIIVALGAAMVPGIIRELQADAFPASAVPGLIGLGILAWLGLIVAGAMVRVGLMRKALGMQEGRVFLYFSFAAPVWRMLGALFLAVLVLIGIGLASAAAVGIVWGIGRAVFGQGTAGAITGVAGVIAVLWYIYASVRLVFFLPAVVVAEEQIGIGRSWSLGGGNFWRIFVVALAVIIPVVLLFGILGLIVGTSMTVPLAEPTTPHDVVKLIAQRLSAAVSPFAVLLDIAYITALAGLWTGAVAGAYRAIVPAAKDHAAPAETTPA